MMPDQVSYYNYFGQLFRESILNSPEPHYWTTDYAEKGRVYKEMKERVSHQRELVSRYFSNEEPVFDIGCGFGRQAYMMAKEGFLVYGTDTSNEFVLLAQQLFKRHKLAGSFECADITKEKPAGFFRQAVLFDVLEHIPPRKRANFIDSLSGKLERESVIIISLPKVKKRFSSWVNNKIVRGVLHLFPFYINSREHPYPIPVASDILKAFNFYELLHRSSTYDTDYYVFRKR